LVVTFYERCWSPSRYATVAEARTWSWILFSLFIVSFHPLPVENFVVCGDRNRTDLAFVAHDALWLRSSPMFESHYVKRKACTVATGGARFLLTEQKEGWRAKVYSGMQGQNLVGLGAKSQQENIVENKSENIWKCVKKYVHPSNNTTEIYAGRIVSCPLPVESRWVCAARPIKIRKKDGTDRQTDGRQTSTLRLLLDAASIEMKCWCILTLHSTRLENFHPW